MNLVAVDIADDEQRRVAKRLAVIGDLLVCGMEVAAFALVLPGEVAPEPDVGESFAIWPASTLFERVEVTGRVGLSWRLLAK